MILAYKKNCMSFAALILFKIVYSNLCLNLGEEELSLFSLLTCGVLLSLLLFFLSQSFDCCASPQQRTALSTVSQSGKSPENFELKII